MENKLDTSRLANPWPDRINEAYYGLLGEPFGRRTRERIHWICSSCSGKRVLDVGCSQGITTILLAREGFEVTGVDISQFAIEYAKGELDKEVATVKKRTNFLCVDFATFESEPVDTVVMGEVLEHQTKPRSFLKKAIKFIKKGGRLVMTVPYGLHPWPDHKTTIFPSWILAVIGKSLDIEFLDIQDGYIHLIASKLPSGIQKERVGAQKLLIKVTEEGALEFQRKYYNAIDKNKEITQKAQLCADKLTNVKKELKQERKKSSQLLVQLESLKERKNFLENQLEENKQQLEEFILALVDKNE